MNICLISNFSKTHLFSAIGKSLSSSNINIFWIACNQKLYTELCSEYGNQNVLLINKKNIFKTEKRIGDFKLNELVYGDRVLKNNLKDGIDFLTNIQKPIFEFLYHNNISKVFGEVTWAHELLVHRMCSKIRKLNCQYLNPHVIRIPNQRFAFFKDEKQSQLLNFNLNTNNSTKSIVPTQPNYLKINKKILKSSSSLKGKLMRIKRFFTNENIDKWDPTLNSNTKTRIITSVREEWQRLFYKIVSTSDTFDFENKKYLFLGLHKQPEASVDVLGRYYEDQFQNIVNLWRSLPADWNFVIKEHSIAIGDRALSFYRKIKALPNVVLINENIPSYTIIKHANLVATVSGTIAYEAALMGIPSITFAPTFFNGLNCCKRIRLKDLDKNNLEEISQSLTSQPNNLESFSKFIYSNSFKGNVLDPVSVPKVLNASNISILSEAFKMAIFKSEQSIAV